ncbi:MAG: hypothetical protein AB7G52_10415 [Arcobacter sp.]
MSFVKSDYTISKYIDIETNNNISLLFNSYKDKSVEVTLTDKQGYINIDIDILELSRKYINNQIIVPIKKLLNLEDIILSNKIISEIIDCILYLIKITIPFNGRPTLDYNIHTCHSKLILGKKD